MQTRRKNSPKGEAAPSESTAPPNEDWLALSSTISMLCEADLMALDEDLQEVPWGLVSGASEPGEHSGIMSSLASLDAPPLTGLNPATFGDILQWRGQGSAEDVLLQPYGQAHWNGTSGPSSPVDEMTASHQDMFAAFADPDATMGAFSEDGFNRPLPRTPKVRAPKGGGRGKRGSVAAGSSNSVAQLVAPTPTKINLDHARQPLSARPQFKSLGVGRRISFSTPSPTGLIPLSEEAAKEAEAGRAPSPFGKSKRSASPFSAIKPPPASLDTLRNINLMINRAHTSSRGRPRSQGRPSSSLSVRSSAPSPAPAGPRPSSAAARSTPRPPTPDGDAPTPTPPPQLLPPTQPLAPVASAPVAAPSVSADKPTPVPDTPPPVPAPVAVPPVPDMQSPHTPSLQHFFAPKSAEPEGRVSPSKPLMRSFGGLGGTLVSVDDAKGVSESSPTAAAISSQTAAETPSKGKRLSGAGKSPSTQGASSTSLRASKRSIGAAGGPINFTVKASRTAK